MKNKMFLLTILCVSFISCTEMNQNNHNPDDAYSHEIDARKSELSDLDSAILQAKIKLLKIKKYIALKLEELRKLYGDPSQNNNGPPTGQVPPSGHTIEEAVENIENNQGDPVDGPYEEIDLEELDRELDQN